ncbi:OLC1v1012167C2 [Oldenlandia corymbosa var. corymbosa]|nr:OLC1v1012167C2 [Oldenlandia corymbosa var. corymbosa]
MAKFPNYVILFLLLSAFAGVLEIESARVDSRAEAEKTAFGVRKMLDPPTEEVVEIMSEVVGKMFKRELEYRLTTKRCYERCIFAPVCVSAITGCHCEDTYCVKKELTPVLGSSQSE